MTAPPAARSRPRPRPRPRAARLLAAVVVVLLLAACGDGAQGDDGAARPGSSASTASTPPEGEVPDLASGSGDAPAARGAGLDAPPGEPDRAMAGELGDYGFGEVAVAVTAPDGTVTGWCVLLALTTAQHQRGLMEVTDLGGYAGMLFAFPSDNDSGFYMRNTPTPLSIGWFDADGELVSTADMEPCADVDGCPTYSPDGPYRFALEVPQGRLDDLGVESDARLAVGGPCAGGG